MRKFTLTAIAIKDEKVVGVFKVLEQTPKFDGALLSCSVIDWVGGSVSKAPGCSDWAARASYGACCMGFRST